MMLQAGLITGWGYTETTKILKPRPLTSDVLREAEIYILPQVLQETRQQSVTLPRNYATSSPPSQSPTGWSAPSRDHSGWRQLARCVRHADLDIWNLDI